MKLLALLLITSSYCLLLASGWCTAQNNPLRFDNVVPYSQAKELAIKEALEKGYITEDLLSDFCFVANCSPFVPTNKLYCFGMYYYKDGKRHYTSIDIGMDLEPYTEKRSFYKSSEYSEDLWDKEKRILHAMSRWLEPEMAMDLWNYKDKKAFFDIFGGYHSGLIPLYNTYPPFVGIEKPKGILDEPKENEMQFDEALNIAYECFWKAINSDFETTKYIKENVKVSSACVRFFPAWNDDNNEERSFFLPEDDWIAWYFQFYVPVVLNESEVVYAMLFDTGAIMESKYEVFFK